MRGEGWQKRAETESRAHLLDKRDGLPTALLLTGPRVGYICDILASCKI